jgi:chromosome segregation ATPase
VLAIGEDDSLFN